ITDLKQRGLLDDTLVIWGGEFGRTVYSQGALTPDNYGRDHHPRCFTVWMAGAGIKAGQTIGGKDDYCCKIGGDPRIGRIRDEGVLGGEARDGFDRVAKIVSDDDRNQLGVPIASNAHAKAL